MGNRLSKISTKTGDKGETGLGDGSRVAKHHIRIQAIGDVDELNSSIGVLLAHLSEDDPKYGIISNTLNQIQHDLFDIGGELAVPGYNALVQTLLDDLETISADLNDELPALKDFILPAGGNSKNKKATSFCHMSRSICRRAERSLVELNQEEDINPIALQYVNRLSDFFFILARSLVRVDNGEEVLWKSRHQPSGK